MQITKEKVSTISSGLSAFLDGVGKIATIFNPVVGSSVVLAGEVLGKFGEIEDDIAKNKILGLSATNAMLDEIISVYEETKVLNIEALKALSENLKALDEFQEKASKIIG